jgi:hypothetical protein
MASLPSVSALVSANSIDDVIEKLAHFPVLWDEAADLFEKSQQNAIDRILGPIQHGTNLAFLTALTEITKTNIEFIEEACGLYEEHVKTQLRHTKRVGYKKLNLNALVHLRGLLAPIKARLEERLDFEALKAEIQALSDAMTELSTQAEEQQLKKGRFALLIDEITHQLHPLLQLKEKNERFVQNLISTLSEEPAPATENSEALCSELNSKTLSSLRDELLFSNKSLQNSIKENDSISLIQAKFFLSSFIRKAEIVRAQLHSTITRYQYQVKSPECSLREITKNAFTDSLRAAKNNYQHRIDGIINEYRRTVRSQFLWFFRDGYTKLKLLQAAVSSDGKVNLATLQSSLLLNKGKCAAVVQKITETTQQAEALSTFSSPIVESKQSVPIEDKISTHQFKVQYQGALTWLDDTIEEARAVQSNFDDALKSLISEETDASSSREGVEESKQPEGEAPFLPPTIQSPQAPRGGNPFRAFMGPSLPRFTSTPNTNIVAEEAAAGE